MNESVDIDEINRIFRGDRPCPTGTITLDIECEDGAVLQCEQTVTDVGILPAGIRGLLRRLEASALSEEAMDFREVGAWLIVYEDSSYESFAFTSHEAMVIEGKVQFDALFASRILDELDEGRMPENVIHIHLHPGPEYRPEEDKGSILINSFDFKAYGAFSAFLSQYAGQTIPITGLVKPVGEHCGNVFIETKMGPCDAEDEMAQKANEMKFHRAATRANEKLPPRPAV